MLQTRSNVLLVAQVNTSAGGSAVVITNSSNIFITNTSLTVMVQNSAGWNVGVGSTSIVNSAGWIVSVSNTGGAINILNSGGLYAMQSGTWNVTQVSTSRTVNVLNSGGLYAMQSGVWAISSTILNSAGWLVNASCTILNSAGWVVANTGRTDIILNSGGLYSMQSGLWTVSSTILNSAGWIVAASSTILNSAGWVIAQSNTAGLTAFAIDSSAIGAVTTSVASTVGTVVLLASNTKRVNGSIYNASTNPLFMKMGSGAKTTDFTLMMVASGFYELPRPVYSGQITGVWVTANGNAYMTETT